MQFKQRVNAVEITRSLDSLTQYAVIKLPNLQGFFQQNIQEGNSVTIRLGYDGQFQEEFTGYVAFIKPSTPVEIHCEDNMYLLKKKAIKDFSWRTVKLKEILQYIVPGIITNVYDITLSGFKINKVASQAAALQLLKDEYNLHIYYRANELWAGIPYTDNQREVNYHLRKNCKPDDLEFKSASAVKIKLRLISVQKNGSKIEVPVGDLDGEERTLHFYNLTKPELEAMANEQLKSLKYDGYYGSIQAKGLPYCIPGMGANILDEKYPARSGKYVVEEVITTYNKEDGYSRKNKIGPQI